MPRQQSFTLGVLALLVAAVASTTAATPPQIKPAGKQQVTFFLTEGNLIVHYPKAETAPVTVGTTNVYSTELKEGGRNVGNIVWTGTHLDAERVSYIVNCELTAGDYKGTLIASGIYTGARNSPVSTVVVVGGTGDFEGATGTFTWGSPAFNGATNYTFKLALTRKVQMAGELTMDQLNQVKANRAASG